MSASLHLKTRRGQNTGNGSTSTTTHDMDQHSTFSRISPAELRAQLAQDGFVRIPNFLPPSTLQEYRHAAQGAIALARDGKWPYIRTVPKQFPPWNVSDRDKGIWGVQHLLHPTMPAAYRHVFEASYFNAAMTTVVTEILQCDASDLVMELYNMLVTPEQDFALRWHRDDIPPAATAEEEASRLAEPMMHAQWNLALYDDASLVVVPGSHRRPRTEMERGADPMEDDMPGQRVVRMGAGDVVFYNNNVLHRGVYDRRVERVTLHGTMGLTGADPARARNILQHGIGAWVDQCDFGELPETVRGRARAMQRKLLSMGRGEEAGFSQTD